MAVGGSPLMAIWRASFGPTTVSLFFQPRNHGGEETERFLEMKRKMFQHFMPDLVFMNLPISGESLASGKMETSFIFLEKSQNEVFLIHPFR